MAYAMPQPRLQVDEFDGEPEGEPIEECAWCLAERLSAELREMYGDRVCPTCEAEAKAMQKIAADLVRAMDLTRNAMRRAS